MPHLTGTELAAQILEVRPAMKIILCTGFNGKVTAEKMKEMGIGELIMKPLKREEFIGIVRRVLDESKGWL